MDCLFPKSMWNHYDNDGKRSNNYLEGYYSKLNKYLKQHPKFWDFVRHIKSEVVDVELKWHHIQSGDSKSKSQNIEEVERDLYIQKVKCEYLMQKLDIM